MAFWRAATMDSWQPFSRKFWTWRNWFGETDGEAIARHQTLYLQQLPAKLLNKKAKDALRFLNCPLSSGQQRLDNPVILPDGQIVSQKNFCQHLKTHHIRHKDTGRSFDLTDAVPFTTLGTIINKLNRYQHQLSAQKNIYLSEAEQALRKASVKRSPPAIFCSRLNPAVLLQSPYLLPSGELYDKSELDYFLATETKEELIHRALTPLRLQFDGPLLATLERVHLQTLSKQDLRNICLNQCQTLPTFQLYLNRYKRKILSPPSYFSQAVKVLSGLFWSHGNVRFSPLGNTNAEPLPKLPRLNFT